MPSVLWRCWLGGRKGIRSVKNKSGGLLAWLSVWSEVQTCMWPSWCHCHSLSLASVKSRLVLPFWYWFTRVVPEKGPLNACVCSLSDVSWIICISAAAVFALVVDKTVSVFKAVRGGGMKCVFVVVWVFVVVVWGCLPSVLWHCWLGGRKGIRPVKNLSSEVLAWLSVRSEVQTCIWPSWYHYLSLSLAPVKSRLVLPFWYRLTCVVPDKVPLNGCVHVCVLLFGFVVDVINRCHDYFSY